MRILFVCTGNLCRSPMAEALMRAELARRGCADIEVVSAGTWAEPGSPATPEAARAVARLGASLDGHRSRPLEAADLEGADLVVAMTSVHRREIAELAPDARARTVLLKEIEAIEMDEPPPGAGPHQRLRALLSGRRPEPRRALDLDDPMGLPAAAYDRALREIARGVARLADLLCGRP